MALKIEQAFLFDFRMKAFGLPIAYENADYKPTPGNAYVRVRHFPNEETAADLNDTNETNGFFQFTLYYPTGAGAIPAKTMRQTIFDAYPIGRRLTYSGQKVVVTATSPFSAYPEDGWFKVAGRVFYKADVTR